MSAPVNDPDKGGSNSYGWQPVRVHHPIIPAGADMTFGDPIKPGKRKSETTREGAADARPTGSQEKSANTSKIPVQTNKAASPE